MIKMKNLLKSLVVLLLAVPHMGHAQALVIDDDQWNSIDIYFPESLESILFPPNPRWEDLGRFPENSFFRQVSTPVGRLRIHSGDEIVFCTAFLVAQNRILTNHHCVPGRGNVSEALFEVGYYSQGIEIERYSVRIEPLLSDQTLDMSLLELETSADDQWGSATFSLEPINPGDDLFIVHHPGAQPMKVSRIGCFSGPESSQTNGHFLHQCDTAGGSSGSPIFNLDGLVVGIHHGGTPDRGQDAFNRGTQISNAHPFLSSLEIVNPSELLGNAPLTNDGATQYQNMDNFVFDEGACDRITSYRGGFDSDLDGLMAYIVYLSCYTKRFELSDAIAIAFEDHFDFHSANSYLQIFSCDEITRDISSWNEVAEWSTGELLFSATCNLSRLHFVKVRRDIRNSGTLQSNQTAYYIWLNAFDSTFWDELDLEIVAQTESADYP